MTSSNSLLSRAFPKRWRVSLAATVCLCVLLALAVILSTAPARLKPLSRAGTVWGLGYCEKLPCFRKFIPGLTLWADVIRAFDGRLSVPIDPPNGEIQVHQSIDNKTLGRILIRLPDDNSLSVGDVVTFYGTPCGVTAYPQLHKLNLYYPTVRFETRYIPHYLSVNTAIATIEFHDPIYQLKTHAHACVDEQPMPDLKIINQRWHGFASIMRYMADEKNW